MAFAPGGTIAYGEAGEPEHGLVIADEDIVDADADFSAFDLKSVKREATCQLGAFKIIMQQGRLAVVRDGAVNVIRFEADDGGDRLFCQVFSEKKMVEQGKFNPMLPLDVIVGAIEKSVNQESEDFKLSIKDAIGGADGVILCFAETVYGHEVSHELRLRKIKITEKMKLERALAAVTSERDVLASKCAEFEREVAAREEEEKEKEEAFINRTNFSGRWIEFREEDRLLLLKKRTLVHDIVCFVAFILACLKADMLGKRHTASRQPIWL